MRSKPRPLSPLIGPAALPLISSNSRRAGLTPVPLSGVQKGLKKFFFYFSVFDLKLTSPKIYILFWNKNFSVNSTSTHRIHDKHCKHRKHPTNGFPDKRICSVMFLSNKISSSWIFSVTTFSKLVKFWGNSKSAFT